MLAKDMEANGVRLATVMYNLLETLRVCAILLTPFIPTSAAEILRQIGACDACSTWESAAVFGSLPADVTVTRGDNLFPASTLPRSWRSWRRPLRRLRRPLCPLWSWSPSWRRRSTLTPSARAISVRSR